MKKLHILSIIGVLLILLNSCKKEDVEAIVNSGERPKTESIYGGQSISINNRPYQAAIFHGSSFGGGVILNEYWILTAGHVVTVGGKYDGAVLSPSQVSVGVGSSNRNNLTRISVAEIIRHPNFSPNHDIALIRLSNPLQLGNNINAITRANNSHLQYITDNTPAVVSGWGRIEDGSIPINLQSTNVLITNNSYSQSVIYSRSSNNNIQHGPCYGDSGGPLTVTLPNIGEVLVGVVNGWGECHTGEKGYARISYYNSWIQNIISPTPNMSISGLDFICVSGGEVGSPYYTYTINNLPSNASVEWSVSPWENVVIDGPTNSPSVNIILVDNIPNVTVAANVTTSNNNIVLTKHIRSGFPEYLDFHTSGGASSDNPLFISLLSGSSCLSPDMVDEVEWGYYASNGVQVQSSANYYTCGIVQNDGIALVINKPYGIATTLTVWARARNQCGWSGKIYFTQKFEEYSVIN